MPGTASSSGGGGDKKGGIRKLYERVRDRVQRSRRSVKRGGAAAGQYMRSMADTVGADEWVEQAFERARQLRSPSIEQLPVDFKLRQSAWPRRIYEWVFPIRHIFRMGYRHEDEFLEDFMPITPDSYIGRGTYKFVYRLPWQMVIKVGKDVLGSDPIFGSTFREVVEGPDKFLKPEELSLWRHLKRRRGATARERVDHKFARLGMERYHYWKVREELPDLVLPTRFFMGVRYRQRLSGRDFFSRKIMPMDSQVLLVGKHLKEFATAGKQADQGWMGRTFAPGYDFEFDIGRFGQIKKKVLLKITEDFRKLIRFTDLLAIREKLILDIHTENLIITLPDFQLKVFDFHLFDEHLYEPSLKFDSPEKDHIEVIEKFIESFELDR